MTTDIGYFSHWGEYLLEYLTNILAKEENGTTACNFIMSHSYFYRILSKMLYNFEKTPLHNVLPQIQVNLKVFSKLMIASNKTSEYFSDLDQEKLLLMTCQLGLDEEINAIINGSDINWSLSFVKRCYNPALTHRCFCAIGKLTEKIEETEKKELLGASLINSIQRKSDPELIMFLLSQGADVNMNRGAPLVAAIKAGNERNLKLLIQQGTNCKIDGILTQAINTRRSCFVKILIENGVAVLESHLIDALQSGSKDICEIILQNLNTVDKEIIEKIDVKKFPLILQNGLLDLVQNFVQK